MSGGWDEEWDALAPSRPAARRLPGILWVFATVLALLLLTLGALHWRDWTRHDAPLPTAGPQDRLQAHVALCGTGMRATCVVDGDTIWLSGLKIRIADINAPEVTDARCDYELDLGRKATARLMTLLNAGAFSLVPPAGRDADRHGRALRVVTRGGQSLGMVLVREGLAEPWSGHRRNWCEGRG
ncbi:MAG: thermonuclease family protein [Sphingomonadales bacterium]|nr:thermonuclease family protein [Sphingomonadales bacterium]MDE2171081.1 thermonuclease family protein [Sphingomonadales bacterium]